VKIALAQINYHIGNFANNASKIIESIGEAKQAGADLVVFAELAISGYPPRDFLEFDDFISQCAVTIEEIAPHCKNIAAIVGIPTKNPNKKGKPLHNSAAFFLMNTAILSPIGCSMSLNLKDTKSHSQFAKTCGMFRTIRCTILIRWMN